MQNFLNQTRLEPAKRGSQTRIKDFNEIYEVYPSVEAATQAERCIQCGDPYCNSGCPLHNYIPFWLKSIARNDNELAFNISNETNPFPEITGRVCPQDRLCEGACTLNDGHGAITIGSIETHISETGFRKGLEPAFPGVSTDKRVAIVGSGPAGIACATYLLRAGIAVDMYEKNDRPGGLLMYGIPNFKLEKEIVLRRFEWLVKAGMTLHLNTEIGKDISFDEMADKADSVFIAIGAETSKKAKLEHENADGVFLAIEFLKNMQKKVFEDTYEEAYNVKDKNVVVIGGGDTAMDCLRTSLREKAKSVTCLYRRDAENMPGSKKEFKNAVEEGVDFEYNASPVKVEVNSDGKVVGIVMERTVLGAKDADGRQGISIAENSEFRVDADVVIFALGFDASEPDFLSENGIKTDKWGGVVVNDTFETSTSGIYAGGDCFRGADLVVTAASDGKLAAEDMIQKLL